MPLPRIRAGSPQVILWDYLAVLYRRRWLALAVLFVAMAGTAWYTYTAVPLYQATVRLQIDYEPPKVVEFGKVVDEGTLIGNWVQTQYELLTSRALVERTVRSMKIKDRPEYRISNEDAAVGAITNALTVAAVRPTRLVDVKVRWWNHQQAAEIANAHAEQYLEWTLERRQKETEQATGYLDDELQLALKEVQASEMALQNFREQHNAVSLGEGQNIVVARLTELNSSVTKAKLARIDKGDQYFGVSKDKGDLSSLDRYPAILNNGFVQKLKGDIVQLERDEVRLKQTHGDNHPDLKKVRTDLATTRATLDREIGTVIAALKNDYENARNVEESYSSELQRATSEALALDRDGVTYASLEQRAEISRKIYQSLLQRSKEIRVASGITTSNVSITDRARPSRQQVWPSPRYNMIMSFLTGTFLAVGLVFLLEMVDDRIKAPTDIADQLHQTFLGLIPRVKAKKGSRVSIVQDNLPAVMTESFRALRASIITSAAGAEDQRTILVSSSSEGEGKTHVASNLAIMLAQAQYRVLLIDADLRRPSVHRHFGISLEPGLGSVLTGGATLREALQTSVPGLTVLPGGRPSAHAPELLGTPVFKELLSVLHQHFDWVIIDSPPVMTVADARIVAALSSGVVVVTSSGKTRARAARAAVEELTRAGGKVLGVVLNMADLDNHPLYFAPYASGSYGDAPKKSSVTHAAALSIKERI